jgi:hypothetical protein
VDNDIIVQDPRASRPYLFSDGYGPYDWSGSLQNILK